MEDQLLATLRASSELPTPLVPAIYEFGAFLIVKGFPTTNEFGIDYKSWNTGEKFMGMKMIPPGVHFVYYTVKGAPRIGFFHTFSSREIVVCKWNGQKEDMEREELSEEQVERLRRSLRDMDGSLAPYPYENYRQWYSLTDFITQDTISRVHPVKGKITSQAELESLETKMINDEEKNATVGCSNSVDRENRRRLRFVDDQGLPVMNVKDGHEIRFTNIPQLPGDERYADYSSTLERTLNVIPANALLAEMQFAFVVFLIGQVWDGFDQWKKAVHLMCYSPSSLSIHPQLFLDLLRVLFFQLKECPRDFFVDIISRDNFLTTTLSVLFDNIAKSTVPEEVKKKSRTFKLYLEKNFKWSFDV